MKRTLLIALCVLFSLGGFSQRLVQAPEKGVVNYSLIDKDFSGARTTSTVYFDSLVMEDVLPTDTPFTIYYVSHAGSATDSGYFTGENFAGFSGYAERYDFNSTDSQVNVLGVITLFSGNIKSSVTTSQTINIRCWTPAAPTVVRSTLSFSGFPGAEIDSILNIPITQIGIGINDTAPDTFKVFYFPTGGTGYITTSFFVGYTMNYVFGASMLGDTIALQSTKTGVRHTPEWTITSGDTVVNDQVCIQDTSGGASYWGDAWANFGYNAELIIFPIIDVQSNTALSVHGISNGGLTFYGNYPNPAVNNTNISFSLNDAADVQVIITDMNGRTISTANENNLSAGAHTLNLSTQNLPSGNYLCILHTSNGGGIASKLTIVK